MVFGKTYYNNCWFFILALLIKNKGNIVLIRMGRGFRPHPLLITYRGNIVHFTIRKAKTKDFYICIRGTPHIFRSKLLRKQKYLQIKIPFLKQNGQR